MIARFSDFAATFVIGAFERVAQRRAKQAATGGHAQVHQTGNVALSHARTRRIVHQHERVVGHVAWQRANACQHRIATLRATDGGEHRLAE